MKPINGQTKHEYDFPSIEMMAGEAVEQYRGQSWNYHYVRHIPVPQHPPQVRCRNVSTQVTEGKENNSTVRKKIVEQQILPIVEPQNNIAQVHKTNLCDILERRRQVAEAKGDQKLLRLLEWECEYMAC